MGFGDARMAPGASRGCSGERSSALSTQHRPQLNANPPKKQNSLLPLWVPEGARPHPGCARPGGWPKNVPERHVPAFCGTRAHRSPAVATPRVFLGVSTFTCGTWVSARG